MANPLYHIRTYFSCSVHMRDEIDEMSSVTGLSRSEIVRIAVDQLLTAWQKEKRNDQDGEVQTSV